MALSGNVNTSAYSGRYYKVAWTGAKKIDTNKTEITWILSAEAGTSNWFAERTLDVKLTATKGTLTGDTSYYKTTRVERYKGTIYTGKAVISHDANGDAAFKIEMKVAVYTSAVNCTGSASFTLDNIPRKSTLSVGNGTLGTEQTIGVARQSTAFTHTITATCGDATETICTKSTVESFKFTPPLAWAGKNTLSDTVTVKYVITTYNGTAVIGSNEYTKTCAIPASVKPTISLAVSDAMGYLGTYGGYVQGKSKVKCVITAAGIQGSKITSYKTVIGKNQYTDATFTTDALAISGDVVITATVTDSRGRTATATKTITILPYAAPKISLMDVVRSNADGTNNSTGEYLKVTFSAQITSLNNKNTAAYSVKYKISGTDTYTTSVITSQAGKYTVTKGTFVFSADTKKSYDVTLIATDAFTSTKKDGKGGTISIFRSKLWKGLGIAYGKIAELEGYFDIGFKAMFRKTVELKDEIFDKYGIRIGNGLAQSTQDGIDPDTTLEHEIVTHIKTPMGSGIYMYVYTCFFGSKKETSNRTQIAMPYRNNGSVYHRYYHDGAWSEWRRMYNAGENHNVLYSSAGMYMGSTQYANLSQPISKQINGIVLEWSRYLNNVAQASKCYVYIPKSYANGLALDLLLVSGGGEQAGSKSVYITDTKITGTANNDKQPYTGANNIKLSPLGWVLTRVLGV